MQRDLIWMIAGGLANVAAALLIAPLGKCQF
jgi:hypothetical protein